MLNPDTPNDIRIPEGMDPSDEEFGEFFKNEFIALLTPSINEWNITLKVAVPLETGQTVLDSARSISVEHAKRDAEGYISDLATVPDFFIDEINAAKRILELDGFDVTVRIRKADSPRPSP